MNFTKVYFVGIGGIGMSAIARYFVHEGKLVAGYDKTATPLTHELEKEGMDIHYDDNLAAIPTEFLKKEDTLIVYTPAIPSDHSELCYFADNGFEMVKRSKILGVIAADKYVMAISGTHGKTTTTTMTAYFNSVITGGGSAFLGGISKNFSSNLVLGSGDRLAVEADEFDRSFHQLYPNVAVVTATDADHLDIYGTHKAVKEAFTKFISQIKPGGALIIKKGVDIDITNSNITVYRYAYDSECDFYATNIRVVEGGYPLFDFVCPDRTVADCRLGIPGWVNVENAVAALATIWCAGDFDDDKVREATSTFCGVKRRFDFYINTPEVVYIDDYAHHPAELTAAITSLRGMFAQRKITVLFQPHLYTRTRDFALEFSQALSLADKVYLLPIYPARELPIEGVDSQLILKNITCDKKIIQKSEIESIMSEEVPDIFVTFGAGDIDNYCDKIASILKG